MPYSVTSKKSGKQYFLHERRQQLKGGQQVTLYFFAGEPKEGAIDALPEGYAVDTSEDGEEGLYKAVNTPYDAVVLDVMLPRIDGWEVLRKLRETHRTPVLMLTARDRTRDRVQGLDLGADDYLIKPFDLP